MMALTAIVIACSVLCSSASETLTPGKAAAVAGWPTLENVGLVSTSSARHNERPETAAIGSLLLDGTKSSTSPRAGLLGPLPLPVDLGGGSSMKNPSSLDQLVDTIQKITNLASYAVHATEGTEPAAKWFSFRLQGTPNVSPAEFLSRMVTFNQNPFTPTSKAEFEFNSTLNGATRSADLAAIVDKVTSLVTDTIQDSKEKRAKYVCFTLDSDPWISSGEFLSRFKFHFDEFEPVSPDLPQGLAGK